MKSNTGSQTTDQQWNICRIHLGYGVSMAWRNCLQKSFQEEWSKSDIILNDYLWQLRNFDKLFWFIRNLDLFLSSYIFLFIICTYTLSDSFGSHSCNYGLHIWPKKNGSNTIFRTNQSVHCNLAIMSTTIYTGTGCFIA